MAFEWFPYINGKNLNYSEYLTIVGTSIMIINYFFWFTVLRVYRYYLVRQELKKKKILINNQLYDSFEDGASEKALSSRLPRFGEQESKYHQFTQEDYDDQNEDNYSKGGRNDLKSPLLKNDGLKTQIQQSSMVKVSTDKLSVRSQSHFKSSGKSQISKSQRSSIPQVEIALDNQSLEEEPNTNTRFGLLHQILQWICTISFAFLLIPVHGLGYKSQFTTILIFALLFTRRYIQHIYMNYKFILYDIEILDLPTTRDGRSTTQYRKGITFNFQVVESPSVSYFRQKELAIQKMGFCQKFQKKWADYKSVIIYYFKIRPLIFGFKILIIVGSSILLARSTSDLCVHRYQYPDRAGGMSFIGGVQISSSDYRKTLSDTSCSIGNICHVYLTLPIDSSSGSKTSKLLYILGTQSQNKNLLECAGIKNDASLIIFNLWDYFLDEMDAIINSDKDSNESQQLIPISIVAANQQFGYNQNYIDLEPINDEEIQANSYLTWFTQGQSTNQESQLKDLKQAYSTSKLSNNLMIINVDDGYMTSLEKQLDFIRNELAKAKSKYYIVNLFSQYKDTDSENIFITDLSRFYQIKLIVQAFKYNIAEQEKFQLYSGGQKLLLEEQQSVLAIKIQSKNDNDLQIDLIGGEKLEVVRSIII
ncbi:UNKNOWN [Stylonychia lemnae]|uniref:Uncharacterized protein n=1 Tax=Stylonychia lemnae TaxID=5949 RepID=A0A078B720_STYLE|nr:UNKNOWN [Stylonychia lemnae]|eukprot:CDW90315.1 UNKNOWN [Stylonychia lemnae]